MRELRTEKPWRNNEGPGFKSRQLHSMGVAQVSNNLGFSHVIITCTAVMLGLRVKMCVWLGVSRGLDLAFLNAD